MREDGPIDAPLLVAPNLVMLVVPEAAPPLDEELRRSIRHDKVFADLRLKKPEEVGKGPFEGVSETLADDRTMPRTPVCRSRVKWLSSPVRTVGGPW